MEFCPKCHQMLLPKATGGRLVLACRSCGYLKTPEGRPSYRLAKELRRAPGRKTAVIIDEEGVDVKAAPTMNAICPRCGHRKALWWTAQTRRADEGPTIFFRCLKCEHTWREWA